MKKKTSYVYCICRLDRKYWRTINEDLEELGYKRMKCYVPTVSIIRKTKQGKNTYEDVPMLFNYGFVKMETTKAYNRQLLRDLKKQIPGINGWMLSLESMHPKRLRRRVDTEDFDDFSKVAIISKEEFKHYKRLSKKNKVYSLEDITRVPIGSYITLRGYPFKGLGARLDDISYINHTASVTIFPGGEAELRMQLPLDNILYSIYDEYDDPVIDDYNSIDVDLLSEQDQPFEEEFEIELED